MLALAILLAHSPKEFPFENMRRKLARCHGVVTGHARAYRRRMASSKGYGRRGSNRLADMSLPAEIRCKPKRHKARRQKAARAGKQARAAERAMDRERREG